MKKVFLVLIGIILIFDVRCQNKYPDNFYFSVIDGEEGLSRNRVNAILQDSYGFMWFGTSDKLNRFDGYSVKTFDCYDLTARKGSNDIAVLAEGSGRKLWLGTGIGVFIYDPVFDIFTFFDRKTASGTKIESWISDIQRDKDNNMWITVPGQGVFRFDENNNSLHHYTLVENYSQNRDFAAQCICVEKNGTVWVGTRREGLFLYHVVSDSFEYYSGETGKETLKGAGIFKICDYGKYLVVGIHDGRLKLFNKQSKELESGYVSSLNFDVIREVKSFSDGDLWVGTQSGLYILNELHRTSIRIEQDLMNKHSLSDNKIACIYQDRENGIWVGTFFGGACHLPARSIEFEKYIPLSRKNSLESKRIKELGEDGSGNIWIGTEDAGLTVFNPERKEFRRVDDVLKERPGKDITGFFVDKNDVYIGYFHPGMDVITLPGYGMKRYSGLQTGTGDESIYTFFKDKAGNLWIGTLWSLYFSPNDRLNFSEIESMRGNFVFDISEDGEGFIWIATLGQGVVRYDPRTKESRRFYPNDGSGFPSNTVGSITEDSRGRLWFATDGGGICYYDRENEQFETYGIDIGLPDNTAYKILEDKNRCLWFGTNKGLVRFNPQTKAVNVFTTNDGLPGNQFNYRSALKASSGELYFGGTEGLISFDPYNIKVNDYIPPVFITKMTVANKEIEPHGENSLVTQSVFNVKKITLPHDRSSVSFEFAALSYTSPPSNKYAYKMENVDKDWIYTENNHSASYAKLPPGHYTFRVKGSNNDGILNDEGAYMEITILPPWWFSPIAYIVYVLSILGLAYYCFRRYKRRQEQKTREKLHFFETEKEKELYRSKIDFFTGVAHEIRTPLALINGPLENMIEMNIDNEAVRKNLNLMEQNTGQLRLLINQLLDFRKVDSNKLVMNYSEENINDLLIQAEKQFEPLISKKKRSFKLHLPEENISAVVDRDALTKIINNLFSNAVKYSDREIEVELRSEKGYFLLLVRNDGEPVSSEYEEKIFEPFFRLATDSIPGSGIGLSVSRSLAELQNGSLHMTNRNGLNEFVLKLPLEQENVILPVVRNEPVNYVIEEEESKSELAGKHTILLVEDNEDMLAFIAEKLRSFFSVEKAEDGVIAMKILGEKNIDLIVSDIMMEHMNGLELCRQVKSNIEYSHIPVVLLTAKNDLAGKIEGLEAGADAYIEKPFSFNYLITQLNTLLINRMRERKAFMQNPLLSTKQSGMNKADELFLNKLIESIHENITDYNFGVEKLAEMLAMSRSNLHRKVKMLTDLSPTDFIRLIRLRKAAELIQGGEYRIGDICFMVGVNSQPYFSKIFQKQFGMTPKEFEKASRNMKAP